MNFTINITGSLAPPEIDEPYLSQNYDKFKFKLNEASDILISGLTFVSVAKQAKVTVTVPKGVNVSVRSTIFKGVQ